LDAAQAGRSESLSVAGASLALRWFEPEAKPWAAVLLAPAMGVEAAYYGPFCAWLAAQGVCVLSFDYRGMGASRPPGSLRGVQADLDTWAADQDAVLMHLAQQQPGLPLLVLGNSLGAQLVGSLPSRARIQGLLALSMGSGYVGHLVPSFQLRGKLFLRLLAPMAVALFGYFPGKRLGVVGDLPRGAMLQWRRWCLSPQYLLSSEGRHALYKSALFPVTSLYAADDEMLAEPGARMMFAAHGNPRHFEVLEPLAGQRIGHLGIFKTRHQATLWPRLLHHLKELST
jgi:predicted alpha/beta hydrolase